MTTIYKDKKILLFFTIPAFAFVALFIFYPSIMNFYYSLFRWASYSKKMKFVGLSNIRKLFADAVVWKAFANNVLYAVYSLVFQVCGGLVLAHVINLYLSERFARFSRVILFIPAVVSITAIGLLWMIIYSPSVGFLNPLLRLVGLGMIATDWLGNKETAMRAVIMVSQWQYLGEMVMLFTVGLQNVPKEIYDSSRVDGANGIQTFFHITIPMIKENILMNVTITIIGAFMVFDEVYVMTSGGPGRATEVLATLLYKTGFRMDKMGYASAISVLLFVITFLLSIIQLRTFNVKFKEGKEK
ncbi:MAG: sugar ABC transporter permease [Spirochaetia bacterium]|jgi:raffinose/stachyose/melibiose transport system permease protein|nr:sugar ABC transporter permease [Spirochaetia bacterium]